MMPNAATDPGRETIARVVRRLVPFMFICYVIAYIDRVNIGFAKAELQRDLGLSDAAYGLGGACSSSAIVCSRFRAIWCWNASVRACGLPGS